MATVGAVLFAFRGRWQPAASGFPLAIGVLAVGSLLTNPHVYLQDTVIIGLALVLGFVGWRGKREMMSIWIAFSLVAWFLVSRTMELQAERDLNLLTPFAAVIFGVLAWGASRQHSTESVAAPKSLLYDTPEVRIAEKRMAS